MPTERIYVTSGPEFAAVVAALTKVDASMNRRLGAAMNKGIDVHIKAAQADVLSLELPGGQVGRRGLQGLVARGVGKATLSGPNVNRTRVITTMPEVSMAVIPRGMDRPQGWKHPVFGNKSRWVRQLGGSWFMPHMSDSQSTIEESLTDVLERAAGEVGRAGGVI